MRVAGERRAATVTSLFYCAWPVGLMSCCGDAVEGHERLSFVGEAASQARFLEVEQADLKGAITPEFR